VWIKRRKQAKNKIEMNTYIHIFDSLLAECKLIAPNPNVRHEIYSTDQILKIVFEHPQFKSERDAIVLYFNDGKSQQTSLRVWFMTI
jgi:hypothetical protein